MQRNPQFWSMIISGFFMALFVVATVLNIIQGDYVQALGFVLLTLSNLPPLIGAISSEVLERFPAEYVRIASNVLAVTGLALVVVSWLGWI